MAIAAAAAGRRAIARARNSATKLFYARDASFDQMRRALALLLILIALAPTAIAPHGAAERVGVQLSPCYATLELGASLPYYVQVTNYAEMERLANISVQESSGRFPPLIQTTDSIPAGATRAFPLWLVAPNEPGAYQLTALANLSHDFGGTHAELHVIERADGEPAVAMGACTQPRSHTFAPGQNAVLSLEATLTGREGRAEYRVIGASNETVATGVVDLQDNSTLAFDVPLGETADMAVERSYRVVVSLLSRPSLSVEFNVLVVWDPSLGSSRAGELIPILSTPSALVALGFVGGGATAIALARGLHRRFAAGWLFGALYSRFARGEILAQPQRAKIFEVVSAHPGITVQALAEEANSYVGAVAYHLRVLQRAGYVSTRQETAGRRVFPVGFKLPDPSPLTRVQEQIIAALRERPMSAKEVATELGITRQGAHFHLKALEGREHVVANLSPEGHLVYVAEATITPKSPPISERQPTDPVASPADRQPQRLNS